MSAALISSSPSPHGIWKSYRSTGRAHAQVHTVSCCVVTKVESSELQAEAHVQRQTCHWSRFAIGKLEQCDVQMEVARCRTLLPWRNECCCILAAFPGREVIPSLCSAVSCRSLRSGRCLTLLRSLQMQQTPGMSFCQGHDAMLHCHRALDAQEADTPRSFRSCMA